MKEILLKDHFRHLPWKLIAILVLVQLVRPLSNTAGVFDDFKPEGPLILTALLMAIWVGAMVLGKIPEPIKVLAIAGAISALANIAMTISLQTYVFSSSGVTADISQLLGRGLLLSLVMNVLGGAFLGLMTLGIRKILGERTVLGVVQVLSLAGLSAIGAELLAAYAENTGDIGAILFALIFFMALYGAPALLAREIVRRAGWGWPSLLLLTLGLAIGQACIIDQSLFAEEYEGYEGWVASQQSTLIPFLSISASNAFNFILGHVIFSFGAPIAIAEAWRPHRAEKSWLGPIGIMVALAAYLGAALMIMSDPESQSASATQLVASIILVATSVASAWLIGKHHVLMESVRSGRIQIHPIVVFGVIFVLDIASNFAGEDWVGFALGLAIYGLIGALIWWGARQSGWWGMHHIAAVGFAFLVARGALAFTYFPLAGEVEAIPKYAHNIVMMATVLLAGWFALRSLRRKNRNDSKV